MYNILDMDEYRKTPEQKFSGVELQNFPTYYHTLGCPVFVLEAPLKGGPTWLTKSEPRAMTRIYLVHSPFHAGWVELLLNTRTGHVSPQYHVVTEYKLITVEKLGKAQL